MELCCFISNTQFLPFPRNSHSKQDRNNGFNLTAHLSMRLPSPEQVDGTKLGTIALELAETESERPTLFGLS